MEREDGHQNIQNRFSAIETDALIRFFLYTMGQPQRHELMGRYPLIYAKLYPGVGHGAIIAAVEAQIAQVAG